MPIYEYHCEACGKDFEELVFGDKKPPCPSCGSGETDKLISRCRFKTGPGSAPYAAAPAASGAGGGGGGCSGCSGGNCSTCS